MLYEVITLQIDRQHLVPEFGRILDERLHPPPAGCVDEHVDTTAGALEHLRSELVNRAVVRQIELDIVHLEPRRLRLLLRRGAPRLIDISEKNLRAGARQLERGGLADPRA